MPTTRRSLSRVVPRHSHVLEDIVDRETLQPLWGRAPGYQEEPASDGAVLTGHGPPPYDLGGQRDTYIDLDTGTIWRKT
jgi:hypothetical protein